MRVLTKVRINGILNIVQQSVDRKNGLIVHGMAIRVELNNF